MSGRVTKGKAKPRKAPEAKFDSDDPTDSNLMLLWLCMNNMSATGQVNMEPVASALNITVNAARKRYRRLKDKMNSMMVTLEKHKGSKAASASKPAQSAKQGNENEGQNNNSEEPAEDI
ncbi:uncharacterized protein N7496_007217 [Penicillium cataractarum]|uniref:Myb-like DNA-binding domain-containing protein n=1 Tax=Penicillium cataractarum TaxID=2100454 RepID=A0A9W9V9A5_9EURO|nr:uncharacterized protein N7496_007217 [Penicillium cataractarum]KAJ5371125.1 hypothetical protein N7496_007217 [Penicillium cataractarum]